MARPCSRTLVAVRTPRFISARVDLSRWRAVHVLEHDPCCPDPALLPSRDCHAVHRGLCSPLIKLPPISLPPAHGGAVPSSRCPVDLLAEDLEDQLNALLNAFGRRRQAQTRPVSQRPRPLSPVASVVERALQFECRPENLPASHPQPPPPKPVVRRVPPSQPPRPRPACVVGAAARVPRFYFPHGRPHGGVEAALQPITAAFSRLRGNQATGATFPSIVKACGLPLYWKGPLFSAVGGPKRGYVCCDTFLEYWRRVISTYHDPASQFIHILTRGLRSYLVDEDFMPLLQDIVHTHPGLSFLQDSTQFHSRYIATVIARIFFCVNRSWSGEITAPELRRSNFLAALARLEFEEDINVVTDYFSYEHFYVIYCKFWQLDSDHDLLIDRDDLARHSNGAISRRMIDRIFSGAVIRSSAAEQEDKMTYLEFVWFLLAEEDKRHPTSIEYWFRCMDLDGDGFLSMFELEYFYEEQLQRMEALGIESLPFKDCLCQMLDMVRCSEPGKITLGDLKRSKMAPLFFDTFFNLEKLLDHEQRDPFASQKEQGMSDWERYTAEEYEALVAEETCTPMLDELSPNLDDLQLGTPEEDDYAESDGESPF